MMVDSIKKRKRKTQRRRSQRIYFNQHKGKLSRCFHCGCLIVWLSKILRQDRIEIYENKFKAKVRIANSIVVLKIASIDHFIPLREDGKETLENLIPSCVPCNKDRDAEDSSGIYTKRCNRCNRIMRGKKNFCKPCRKFRFFEIGKLMESRSIHLGRS